MTSELERMQGEAIQQIRYAQLAWEVESGRVSDDERWILDEQRYAARCTAEDAELAPQHIAREFASAWENSQFTGRVQCTLPTGRVFKPIVGFHPNEQEAAQWIAAQVSETTWCHEQAQLTATIHQRGNDSPVRHVVGGVDRASAETSDWSRPDQQMQHEPKQNTRGNAFTGVSTSAFANTDNQKGMSR